MFAIAFTTVYDLCFSFFVHIHNDLMEWEGWQLLPLVLFICVCVCFSIHNKKPPLHDLSTLPNTTCIHSPFDIDCGLRVCECISHFFCCSDHSFSLESNRFVAFYFARSLSLYSFWFTNVYA